MEQIVACNMIIISRRKYGMIPMYTILVIPLPFAVIDVIYTHIYSHIRDGYNLHVEFKCIHFYIYFSHVYGDT